MGGRAGEGGQVPIGLDDAVQMAEAIVVLILSALLCGQRRGAMAPQGGRAWRGRVQLFLVLRDDLVTLQKAPIL